MSIRQMETSAPKKSNIRESCEEYSKTQQNHSYDFVHYHVLLLLLCLKYNEKCFFFHPNHKKVNIFGHIDLDFNCFD